MLPTNTLNKLQQLPQITQTLNNSLNSNLNNNQVLDPSKPTLVKFWASWCPLCLSTLAETEQWRINDKFAGLNVVTVASPNHLSEKPTDEFVEWYSVVQKDYPNLPVLIDESGELIKSLGVQVYPSWAILDSKGNLVYLNKGNLSEEQAMALADNASNDFAELKGKTATTVKPATADIETSPTKQTAHRLMPKPSIWQGAVFGG